MNRKNLRILTLLVVVILGLAGCTTTNPSIKDAWLNAMNQKSAESKMTFSANVDLDGMNLDKEQKQLFSLLESGFVMEQKAQDENNAYIKITAVNDQPLRDLGYWTAKETAAIEMLIRENTMFFRTSADPYFFEVDMDEVNDLNGTSQSEMQEKLMEFMKGSFTDYISQFNYEIPNLQDLGWKTIQTPEGNEQVLNVKIELSIDDILDFISYTLGNLANYDSLDRMVKEYMSFLPADVQPSEEEIETSVTEAQKQMNEFKAVIDGTSEESLEQLTGLEFDFKAETELGISKGKHITSEDTVISIDVKNPATGEEGHIVIKATSLVWNVNGNVELPTVDKSVNALDFENNINKVRELSDDSPLKKLFLQNFNATFTIGESYAVLGTTFTELDAPPYIKEGSTMVPLATVGNWLNADVDWNASTQQVTLDVNNTSIQLKIGSKSALVNGNTMTMNTSPEIVNGRTFVPVSFISSQLGAQSSFEPSTGLVTIYFE